VPIQAVRHEHYKINMPLQRHLLESSYLGILPLCTELWNDTVYVSKELCGSSVAYAKEYINDIYMYFMGIIHTFQLLLYHNLYGKHCFCFMNLQRLPQTLHERLSSIWFCCCTISCEWRLLCLLDLNHNAACPIVLSICGLPLTSLSLSVFS